MNPKSCPPLKIRANLGNALARLEGQTDEAIAAFHKAIEIFPGYALAYTNLGVTFVQIGRPDEAIPLLQKATELVPDVPPKLIGNSVTPSSPPGDSPTRSNPRRNFKPWRSSTTRSVRP